ncbi:hypothetical protein N9I01_00325 [bacterium]|nr:hypothetical protein [bacterium]
MKAAMIIASLSLLFFSTDVSSLSLTQKHFIQNGNTCCYSKEVIDSVQVPTYEYSPSVVLDLPPLKEPASILTWTLFYTLQVLDVYTTSRALEYNCIKEVNPILGKSPTVDDIIKLKVLLFAPSIWHANKYEPWSNEDIAGANYLMVAVVANNFDVWNEAKTKENCIKIR